ncbi:hypothetical protein [Methylobacterium sp. J-077]|uniref:hypothetical protein n=1 Tax=Methylobacterium sp. J-077 TaxID=2836656 RepID=UPI001FBAC16B|nr:hypothetical protein [Methylobacterium sp. J-077]MCJ2121115.1 hypothetical protein [Methylobacterium sp. J-077]
MNNIDLEVVQLRTDQSIRLEEDTMSMKTLALATAMTLPVTGAALAQMPAGSGSGSAQSNMNNPGSVKSPSEKRMGGQRSMMGIRHMKRHRRHHMRRSHM